MGIPFKSISKSFGFIWQNKSDKMFRILLTVLVSFLFLEQVSGKQCYACRSSNDMMDSCGDFDSSTPKCSVPDDVDCYTSIVTAEGETASDHGCDDVFSMCGELDNECVDQDLGGITPQLCCCDGELCNSR